MERASCPEVTTKSPQQCFFLSVHLCSPGQENSKAFHRVSQTKCNFVMVQVAHQWRTGVDVFASWDAAQHDDLALPGFLQSILTAINNQEAYYPYSAPGAVFLLVSVVHSLHVLSCGWWVGAAASKASPATVVTRNFMFCTSSCLDGSVTNVSFCN